MQYLAISFMNWSELIAKLVRDFRLSEPELAQKAGITYPTIQRIRATKTSTPNQNTIKKIEDALQIKIDDTDPENITYIKLPSVVKEASQDYSITETITRADLELLEKLKEMGIDTVEKLAKLCNYEDITEDIKEILRKRLGPK